MPAHGRLRLRARARCSSTSPIPIDDDNGPGNYAYPTSTDFHAGAFDIQAFQVYDAGADVIFRVKTRDLTPTFGSPLGAQLVDVYVHDPAAATTSTAAAHPLRNFTIAPTFAWSRLIQVQGFGQRYVDAHGDTLGTVAIKGNAISRFITFRCRRRRSGRPARAGGSPSCSPARTASVRTRRAASSRRRRTSSSASARPQRRSALHRRPEHRPEGDRRDHAARRHPVGRARLHAPQPGDADRGHDPVGPGRRPPERSTSRGRAAA